ncbi:unnamed protein product [Dibothriocephalus latus]|uniref:Uncharacterized protein n=1 Tax=Dibothriocephalus latus TaxID=60516 RepID=A0A3P7M686_DIBLA|nr:unnamed protein product [Dibothriocephalus latus]
MQRLLNSYRTPSFSKLNARKHELTPSTTAVSATQAPTILFERPAIVKIALSKTWRLPSVDLIFRLFLHFLNLPRESR